MVNNASQRVVAFRTAIARFIDERHEAKKKGAKEEEVASLAARYDYANWLADAAHRVGQIQAVTHVLKATHPDARGSSFHMPPARLPQHVEIGTHSLGADYADDVMGNAAALDVYKFLKVVVDGRRLLDWFLQGDPDLLAALHDNADMAREWAAAFSGLIRPASALVSHEKAKQVYWCHSGNPTDNAGFHLLQPMFSSALAHAVHADIQDARFGEANKAARTARWENKPCESTYQEYKKLAICKLGGTKPQNISQLNSERGGVNYLLASLPPVWRQGNFRNLLGLETVFPIFMQRKEVAMRLRKLYDFLKANPKPTMETRKKREERFDRPLGMELAAFGMEMQQQHNPGWTRDVQCKLPLCEQLWLDPERADLPFCVDCTKEDEAFQHEFVWKDWPDEVATRFAQHVNEVLRKEGFHVGTVELKHWARQAIVDAAWPATMRRRAIFPGTAKGGDS